MSAYTIQFARIRFVRFVFLAWLFFAAIPAAAQNFWKPATGLYGGTVWALAINSAGHIFAGTNGGIFRSTDNGNSWTPVNTGLTNSIVYFLAINSAGHIFAGTGGGGVFRSIDNGNSWMPVNTGLTDLDVYFLAINSSGHIFAGTHNGGVFRSMDNGSSWTPVKMGLPNSPVYFLAFNSVGDIFAGTFGAGIFRSTDKDSSWIPVNTGLTNLRVWPLAINSAGHIFAGTSGGGVFRSVDNGDSWTLVNTGLTNSDVYFLTINSTGHIFAGTAGGVFRSTDNGSSWTPFNTGLTNSIVYFLLPINSPGVIFAGTAGGVFLSIDNGGNWMPVNTGLTATEVRALAINFAGHIFAGTFGSGVFRSTDNGGSWTLVNAGLANTTVRSLAINSAGHIFAGTSGGVFRSTNNGDSWTPINTGLTINTVRSLAINSAGHIFAGTSGGVFRSTNNGDSWTPVNTGLTINTVRSLAINFSGHIFAGTSGGVFRSIDNGSNWTRVNAGMPNTIVLSLVINSAGDIFAGTFDGGIFRSTDNGSSWISVSTGLTNSDISSLVINLNGYIFAGANGGGIFRSTDGLSWVPDNAGLTNTFVNALSVNSKGRIFAGTLGNGVFFSSQPPVVAHTRLSQQQIGQKISIVAKITDEDPVNNVILNYRVGGIIHFTALVFSAKGDSFAATIPADSVTSRGLEYFITATDADGIMTREPLSGVFSVQVNVPAGVKKAGEQPFGSEQNAYRLISMPLDLDKKTAKEILEDNLGTYDKKKWRFFALRPDQNYTEISDSLMMTSGKAYLLIVKEPGKIIDTGAGISIRTDKQFAIPLNPEWNFIGNPFNFSILLKNFSLKSGQLLALRYHEGTWRDPILRKRTAMQPFEGYAVFNGLESSDTLLINPDLSSSTSSLSQAFASTVEENISWSIRILAQCQEAQDEDNRAAIVSGASSSWDDLDQPEPPVIGEYVSVCFPHPEWNKLAKIYCTDFRPESAEGHVWPFEVKTNIRDKVNLTFEGIDGVPSELEIWLMDDALKITQNLRESNHYAVAGSEQPKQLKLVVGKGDFVGEKLAEAQAIPATYELSQNFPNPFNPATTIRYGLPKGERVTLKIYNLLGEEVALIMNDELRAAGYHAAI